MPPNVFVYVSKCVGVCFQMLLCICPDVFVYLSKCFSVCVIVYFCAFDSLWVLPQAFFFPGKRPFLDLGDMPHWRKHSFSVVLCIWGPLGHLWSPFDSLWGGLGSPLGGLGVPCGCFPEILETGDLVSHEVTRIAIRSAFLEHAAGNHGSRGSHGSGVKNSARSPPHTRRGPG